MRYITESELRSQFANGLPDRYFVPADARLTPAAEDYLTDVRVRRCDAPPEGVPSPAVPGAKKPEHMTHLNSRELVCKTHPEILLRGKLDSLECEILVMMASCAPEWRGPLGDALKLTRLVMSSAVRNIPLPPWTLAGMDEDAVHRASHHPEQFGFAGHILPAPEQGLAAAQLNRLRTMARETELAAVSAFWDGKTLKREDCVKALNRLSSYFYVLQLRAVSRRG